MVAAVLLQGFKAKSLNNTSDFHYPGRGSGPLSSLILRNTERGQAPGGVTWSFPSLGSKESELVENSAGFCKASATCGRARVGSDLGLVPTHLTGRTNGYITSGAGRVPGFQCHSI